jgi:hypothetical protein
MMDAFTLRGIARSYPRRDAFDEGVLLIITSYDNLRILSPARRKIKFARLHVSLCFREGF